MEATAEEDLQTAYRAIIHDRITDDYESRLNAIKMSVEGGSMPSRFTIFYWLGLALYLDELAVEDSTELLAISNQAEPLISELVLAIAEAVRTNISSAGNELLFAQGEFIKLYKIADNRQPFTAEEKRAIENAIARSADHLVSARDERGSMNRAAMLGYGLAETIKLLPDHSSAIEWAELEAATWEDWYHFKDTYEDSSGYNGLWLFGVIKQAMASGREETLLDVTFLDMAERLAISISPNGALANFGDSYFGHGAYFWAYALEYLGMIAPARSFQEKADQLIFHIRDTSLSLRGLDALVGAFDLSAGRSVNTSQPLPGSTVTYRPTEYGDLLFDKMQLQIMTPHGPSHVLVNLHSLGYHGHQDSGAISLWTLGENTLMNELGREAVWSWTHHSATATGYGDPLFKGLSLDNIIPSGELMEWEVSHRWPGTYSTGPTLDIKRVNEFFIRVQDVSSLDGSIKVIVEGVYGIRPDGSEVKLHSGFSRTVQRSSSIDNERDFVRASFANGDLSPYERLLFNWSIDFPSAYSQIGLRGFSLLEPGSNERATMRWRRFIHRTTSAEVMNDDKYTKGVVTRRIRDIRGRELTHTRSLILTRDSGSLIVIDKMVPDEAGDYRLGANWHTQQIIWNDDRNVWIRELSSGSNLDPIDTPAPMWGVFSSTHSAMLEIVTEDVGGPQSKHLAYAFNGQLAANEAVEFITVWKPYPGKSAPFQPVESVNITRDQDVWMIQLEEEAFSVGNSQWAGYDVVGGYVYTGSWLGWLFIEQASWVFSELLSNWLYLPEAWASSEVGSWMYVLR